MRFIFFYLFLFLFSCKNDPKNLPKNEVVDIEDTIENNIQTLEIDLSDSIIENKIIKKALIDRLEKTKKDTIKTVEKTVNFSDEFVNLKDLSNDFVYDIKYATTDNFLKQAVYDCPECYLRKETALALIKVNQAFKEKGYKILIYDCYRPLDVQKKMWAILPGTHYVANPKKGSKHNRGSAVDLTLIDKNGQIVDMGTAFDFFGKEANQTYTKLPKEVLDNRKFLRETLHQFNFRHISSEWWHYEYRPEMYKPVSNFKWACE